MRAPPRETRPVATLRSRVAAVLDGLLGRSRELPTEPPPPLAVLRGLSWDGIERSAGPKPEPKSASGKR